MFLPFSSKITPVTIALTWFAGFGSLSKIVEASSLVVTTEVPSPSTIAFSRQKVKE